jgi:hypothetical protein
LEAGARRGWPSLPDRFRRLRTLCEAYGLTEEDRLGFVKRAIRRMEVTASGIEALAAAGKPAYERLSAAGIPMMILTEQEWIERHAEELEPAFG